MNWKDSVNFEELLKFWIVDPEINESYLNLRALAKNKRSYLDFLNKLEERRYIQYTNLFKEYGVPIAAEKIETLNEVGLPKEHIYYAIEILKCRYSNPERILLRLESKKNG